MTDNKTMPEPTIAGLLRDVEDACPGKGEYPAYHCCKCSEAHSEGINLHPHVEWPGHAAARALAVGALELAEQTAAGCRITDADKTAPAIINGSIMMREIIIGAIRALQPDQAQEPTDE